MTTLVFTPPFPSSGHSMSSAATRPSGRKVKSRTVSRLMSASIQENSRSPSPVPVPSSAASPAFQPKMASLSW